jgi:hypothetical protein
MTSATDKFGIAGMFVDQFDFGSAHTVSFHSFLRYKSGGICLDFVSVTVFVGLLQVDDQFANPATPFVGILGTAQGVSDDQILVCARRMDH